MPARQNVMIRSLNNKKKLSIKFMKIIFYGCNWCLCVVLM